MSKIGRKPIDISGVQVEVKNHEVKFKGPHANGTHVIPEMLSAEVKNGSLLIVPNPAYEGSRQEKRKINAFWGLHRALLFNAIQGSRKLFENKIEIVGLGFKAVASGKKLVFSLGYVHKIDYEVPAAVTVEIDKTGQQLTLKSPNKELLGMVCAHICKLRKPEPYKGTGIKPVGKEIIRKAGKTK